MAYRRRMRRKKAFGRKRTYKRSFLKRKAGKNDGRRFFKLRQVGNATSTVGGGIADFFTMSNPTKAFDNGSQVEDWTSVAALFDIYRVHAVKIKYTPLLPNDTSTVTGFYPLYVGVDVDATTSNPVATTAAAIQYENMTVKNMYRPWTFFRKCKKLAGTFGDGYIDISAPVDRGLIWTWGTNFDVSTVYGYYVVTLYISVKSRR